MEHEAGAMKALEALWKDAELPGVPSLEGVEVAIPTGFSSLFSEVKIDVHEVQPNYFDISWSYKHSSGGNGCTIGYVIYEEKKAKWGWRNETKFNKETWSYNYGYVE